MAIDGNFLAFLVPALIVVLAATVAFPSKSRIERDPSTAYGGGKKALVTLASILALVMGLILALLGGTQNLEELFAGLNMVQIGGISLIIMAVVLLVASVIIGRQIRRAGRGAQEQVMEVTAFPVAQRPPTTGGAPPPRPASPPPRNLPPRDIPPNEFRPRQGVPPPRNLPPRDLPPRPIPAPRDDTPPPPPRVQRRPPPPRHPPPE